VPDVAEQLDALVAGLRNIVGDALVGAYLDGSLLLGGFGPRSDIDVLAVVSRPLRDDEKRRLAELLLSVSGSTRPIELDVIVEEDVTPWRYPPPFDFQYGESLRGEIEAGRWPTGTHADLATVIAVAHTGTGGLAGPPPADVLPAVPRADYLDAILEDYREADHIIGRYPTSLVLALARIWADLTTGEIRSKADAVDWALERLPAAHAVVLSRAWASELGEDELWHEVRPELQAYIAHLKAIIEECLTRPPSPSSPPPPSG